MIEDLFLTYVNNPVSQDPANFDKIIEAIYDFEAQEVDRLYPDEDARRCRSEITPISLYGYSAPVTEHIRRLLRLDYHSSMLPRPMIIDGRGDEEPFYGPQWYRVAYEAVWGNDSDLCADRCDHEESCIACHQQRFISVVEDIIAGNDLQRLRQYLLESNRCTQSALVIGKNPDGAYFKDRLEKISYFFFFFDPTNCPIPGKNIFNHFIESIMAYSLCLFLYEAPNPNQKQCDGQPNRFKLKQCHQCGKFYVINRLPADMSLPPKNHTFCSDKCKNGYHYSRQDREKLDKYRRKQYEDGKTSYFPK